MRDSVRTCSTRYSSVCNVLRQWNISLIPTYRVYQLYDTQLNVNIVHIQYMSYIIHYYIVLYSSYTVYELYNTI